MTEVFYPPRGGSSLPGHPEPSNLADVLERVLDRGIVIAGDIQVNLLDIELLTIKLRLLVASVERAREMGIDWWESDPSLSMGQPGKLDDKNRGLERRLERLESRLGISDGNGDARANNTEASGTMERPRGRRRGGEGVGGEGVGGAERGG
jgi:Gas vesicle protein